MKKIYLIVLVLLCCQQFHAQTQRMDKAVFEQQVLNQSWMAISSDQKEDHEDLFFTVSKDSIAVMYISWIEGGGGIDCTYKLGIIKDNLFELQLLEGQGESGLTYIYGYIPETGKLSILLAEERLKISTGLLTNPDWLELERIKE